MARKKNYLPKRIAGVKVPKSIRRGVLGAFLTSGASQAVVAALILKAGQHLRDDLMPGAHHEGAQATTGAAANESATPNGSFPAAAEAPPGRDNSLNVKHALAEAARAFLLGLSHPKAPGKRFAANAPHNGPDAVSGTQGPASDGRSATAQAIADPH